MRMIENWNKDIEDFLIATTAVNVRMFMVGCAAVNFYGYNRQTAAIDFLLDITPQNLTNLLKALQSIGYPIEELPVAVINKQQNISLKFSPIADEVEFITHSPYARII